MKKNHDQFLCYVNGWREFKGTFEPVAHAVWVQHEGRAWGEWRVSPTTNDKELYAHALKIHGKDPTNKIEPPLQIAAPGSSGNRG
jgi:hypothetical protein